LKPWLIYELLLIRSGYSFVDKIAIAVHSIIHAIARNLGFKTYGFFLLKDVTVKNDSILLFCRRKTSDLAVAHPLYELKVVQFLSSRLKKGDVFIDCGAHIGKYTLLASKLVGARGKVVAIEANPETYLVLTKNLYLNKLTNVTPLNYVIYSHEASAKLFYCHPTETGGSSLKRGHPLLKTTEVKAIKVRTTTLDYLLSQLGIDRVDWIKLDVEGVETEVLQGAAIILSTCRNIGVIFEAWNDYYLDGIKKTLAPYDFTIFPLLLQPFSNIYIAMRGHYDRPPYGEN